MLRKFCHAFHVPGTLSADLDVRFSEPTDCTLVHASAVASNDSDATLKLGTGSDAEAFLAESAIGDSQTPAEFQRADFAGGQHPRVHAGDVFVVTLDYDGDTGTAAADVTIVLTFAEG